MKILYAMIILLAPFLGTSQNTDKTKGTFSLEVGLDRSEIPPTRFKSENINGLVGWNAGLKYKIQRDVWFLESGLVYNVANIGVSEDLSQTNFFTNKIGFASLPVSIGTYFFNKETKIRPVLKTGLVFQKTVRKDLTRTDVFVKKDVADWITGWHVTTGIKFQKLAVLLGLRKDFSNLIDGFDKKNSTVNFTLSYDLF